MCTGIRLKTENNTIVYGRTLEFGSEVKSNIIMIPRGYSFQGTAQKASQGLTWQSKYSATGANMLHVIGLVDGVNEKGLAGGLFYFPGCAEYQKVATETESNVIAPWELITWCLTTCESVAQVKELLPTIVVAPIVFDQWNVVPPLHAIVHDAQGNSLVIEYSKGCLVMHDNSLGVITNAPYFDWHMLNMSNYSNLTKINAEPLLLNGVKMYPFGQGSGMLGLPGDFTPPSRFVRAAFFSQAVKKGKTEYETCKTAFRILDLFNISIGLIEENKDNKISYDYTQWTAVTDLKNRRYYWHTHNNRQVQMVDLMSMDSNQKNVLTIAMDYDEMAYDRSHAIIKTNY